MAIKATIRIMAAATLFLAIFMLPYLANKIIKIYYTIN